MLQAPRPVFAALRNDSAEAAGDRSEPVLAIVLLAGIAAVLSTSQAGRLLDDPEYDALLVAVWAFVAGGMYGLVGYWVVGWLLYRAARALGSNGSYRRARHILAFACVPVALSLVLVPVKISLYGSDVFESGGGDAGGGGYVLEALQLAFFAWAGALAVIGVRAVHGWTSARSATAVAAAAALPVAIIVLELVL